MGSFSCGEGDKGITPIETGQRIHHESQIPDGSTLLEQWDQFILIDITGDLSTKHLGDKRSLHVP